MKTAQRKKGSSVGEPQITPVFQPPTRTPQSNGQTNCGQGNGDQAAGGRRHGAGVRGPGTTKHDAPVSQQRGEGKGKNIYGKNIGAHKNGRSPLHLVALQSPRVSTECNHRPPTHRPGPAHFRVVGVRSTGKLSDPHLGRCPRLRCGWPSAKGMGASTSRITKHQAPATDLPTYRPTDRSLCPAS